MTIAYIKAIKFTYFAIINSKRFFYFSDKLSYHSHNEQYDEVIIAIFYEIIYQPFATNFAYIICQKHFGINIKLYLFYIYNIKFSFYIAISHISSLIAPILNFKSSCFISISICNNIGLNFYPCFLVYHTLLV